MLVGIGLVLLICVGSGAVAQTWMHQGGDIGGSRFSRLTQINRDNVQSLNLAWTYRADAPGTNPAREERFDFQATPILLPEEAGGHLVICTPFAAVVALDPVTGQERWRFEPTYGDEPEVGNFMCRGLSQWHDVDAEAGSRCATRLFLPLPDMTLRAIDAHDGELCPNFGADGAVDMQVLIEATMSDAARSGMQLLSPAGLVRDTVVVTTIVDEHRVDEHQADEDRVDEDQVKDDQGAGYASGTVRGFDARTGELRWTFDPIVRTATDGGQAMHDGIGGGHVRVMLAADEERDLIFLPTASPAPGLQGAQRPGDNRYANSLVALRGSTGEVVWHFQIVHHDVWGRDVSSPPIVVDIHHAGETVPAVIQLSQSGMAFAFNRESGEPLFPIEERPVPTDGIPGDPLSPTQPFTVKPPPLVRQGITPDTAWGFTYFDRGACRRMIEALRYGSMYAPPTTQGTAIYPQIGGGSNWGGGAFDPQRDLLIAPVSQIPYFLRLVPNGEAVPEAVGQPQADTSQQQPVDSRDAGYTLEQGPIMSPFSLPCTAPPWSKLVAVDMAMGEIKWEVPLGVLDKFLSVPLPLNWGAPFAGGPIITAGGLIFIGATADSRFRAFDIDTGEELWGHVLPTSAMATPMTYAVDGRQFVVIAAGGHSRYYADGGEGYLLAWALPQDEKSVSDTNFP